MRVQIQTSVTGPWVEVPQRWQGATPEFARLGQFDRATPVSYRVNATLESGATAELWGYFQVRSDAKRHPLPAPIGAMALDLLKTQKAGGGIGEPRMPKSEIDLLAMADTKSTPEGEQRKNGLWSIGDWTWSDGVLTSPRQLGARLQLPYSPPDEYRLTVVLGAVG